MSISVLFGKRHEGLFRMASPSLVATAFVVAFFCSSNAQAVDSFFDVFIDLSESGQMVMQPVDSGGAFPFPPPPLDFPDIDLGVPGGATVDIEIVALSLVSSQPIIVGDPDPRDGAFQIDSFFDIAYEVNATDSTGTSTFNVDSFFDIAYSMLVIPGPPEILPNGDESRTFDTEILSMDLSGVSPIDLFGDPDFDFAIQLLPGSPSAPDGHVTVLKSPAPGGGDTFNVDSFFDVFVEISVNGGPLVSSTQDSQLRFQAQGSFTTPEPSSLLLGALASMGLLIRRKR